MPPVVLFALSLLLVGPAAAAECPPGTTDCAAARQWHELRDWEPVWRAGLDGRGVVVIFVQQDGDRGAGCGGPDLRRWRNPGETACANDVDDDGNGCVDDCLGCNWSPAGDPERPHGGRKPDQYPYQCYDMVDFVGPVGAILLSAPRHRPTPGRYPGVELFTVVYPTGSGSALRAYLQRLIDDHDGDPHPARRFVIVHKSNPPYRQPLTQADCNAYAEHPPAVSRPGWVQDMEALGSLERTLVVVGWQGGDRFWPACKDPATWLAMGLVRAPGERPENQNPNHFPTIQQTDAQGYYQLPGPTQAPPLNPHLELPLRDLAGEPIRDDHGKPVTYHPLKRFVGYAGLKSKSFHSWQYVATLSYLVPMLQVVDIERIPSEDEVREIWLRCAPRSGELAGPDGVGGWDPAKGYGQPSIACSVLEASRAHGGDIDADGVLDGPPGNDNCPWLANPGQEDVREPGGPGDACTR
jgi:hypothetical protein